TQVVVAGAGGSVAVTAGVGGWRQVFPEPQLEHVPVLEEGVTFSAARSTIGRLAPGEEGHRVRIPVAVQPISAGIKGGLVGGAAMAIVVLIFRAGIQRGLLEPVNLLAAVAIPGMAEVSLGRLPALRRHALNSVISAS